MNISVPRTELFELFRNFDEEFYSSSQGRNTDYFATLWSQAQHKSRLRQNKIATKFRPSLSSSHQIENTMLRRTCHNISKQLFSGGMRSASGSRNPVGLTQDEVRGNCPQHKASMHFVALKTNDEFCSRHQRNGGKNEITSSLWDWN